MNLNRLVGGIIGAVNPQEPVLVYSFLAQTNVRGVVTPQYAAPVELLAQIQNLSSQELIAMDKTWQNENTQSFWLDGYWKGIVRPDLKGGDMIRARGKWWLIVGVPEQFDGWVKVIGELQLTSPTGLP